MKNLYEILEVSEKASKDIIDKVYKVLAKKYHPDLQSSPTEKEKAEEKMKEINNAYSILSDDEKRKKYDLELANKRKIQEKRNLNNINYSGNNTNVYRNPVKTYTNETRNDVQNDADRYEKQEQFRANNYVNNKLNNKMKKEQKKLEKQLKRKMKDAYLKAYGDYLTKNGYKVQYRMDYRKIPELLAVIAILIFIGWILWIIPITHNYLVQVYEENIIIQKIVDIFIKK